MPCIPKHGKSKSKWESIPCSSIFCRKALIITLAYIRKKSWEAVFPHRNGKIQIIEKHALSITEVHVTTLHKAGAFVT